MSDNRPTRQDMIVNDMLTLFTHQFSELFDKAPAGYLSTNRMEDVIDGAHAVLNQHMGEGPITPDVAHRLNAIHNAGYSWQVGYNSEDKEYDALQFMVSYENDQGSAVSSDSLFEAICAAQQIAKENKNGE